MPVGGSVSFFSLVVPADQAQRVAVVTPPDQWGGPGLHSTANSSIKQPSNVLVTKVDFIHKEFWVVLGLQGGSRAGQNSVLGRVRPGNQPEHKVAPQHLKRQDGNGHFHKAYSARWRPLLELTWWSGPAGWKSQLVRLTAAPLGQTVLDNSRSTMYLKPLTT